MPGTMIEGGINYSTLAELKKSQSEAISSQKIFISFRSIRQHARRKPGKPEAQEDCLSLTLHTDIWLVVRVPVLSEQITEVQPRVSTDGRLRTMAFFLAMRRVPRARQVVMTAGRPSGMAATARATAILK